MHIINFTHEHVDQAAQIVKANYDEERQFVPMLPRVDIVPNLTEFADNKLGVVAFDNNEMIGFLCAYYPIEDAWGTTNVKGTFSPIHAHGVIGEDRDRVYSKLYQAAADKWVKEGIVSHSIALYSHDKESLNSFFYNGFGLRCIDAIRYLEEIPMKDSLKYEYCELPKDEWKQLLDLQNLLITHLGKSPSFMPFPIVSEKKFVNGATDDIRYFVAKNRDRCIAYIKIGANGENFACEDNGMMNICGACCLPEYRGTGIYHNLLSYLVSNLKREGYTRVGVDFESFNPTARGFWLKYFNAYTNSVVRRIDEKILKV